MQSRRFIRATVALSMCAVLAMTNATELQHLHSSSSRTSSRKMLQLPGGQNQMQGLTNALAWTPLVLRSAAQALNTRGAAGSRNNAAGSLAGLVTPQGMQGAVTAAQRAMGQGRKLHQFNGIGNRMAANNARAQLATSDSIAASVASGASLRPTQHAGSTGSLMSWASAQNDQRVFNAAERSTYG